MIYNWELLGKGKSGFFNGVTLGITITFQSRLQAQKLTLGIFFFSVFPLSFLFLGVGVGKDVERKNMKLGGWGSGRSWEVGKNMIKID